MHAWVCTVRFVLCSVAGIVMGKPFNGGLGVRVVITHASNGGFLLWYDQPI